MHGLKTIYGLVEPAVLNSGLFIFFACGFFQSRTRRHWSMYGPIRAFVTAFFTDMYGVALTIYLVSGWFQPRLPGVEALTHLTDRLFQELLGLSSPPHLGLLMLLGFPFIDAGAILTGSAWAELYRARRERTIASKGVYAHIRHPLYAGLLLVSFGVLQCPTLATLLMFPVLCVMYVHLARQDERRSVETLGDRYRDYMVRVPPFFPRSDSLARIWTRQLHSGQLPRTRRPAPESRFQNPPASMTGTDRTRR